MWNGKRVVSQGWVEESTRAHVDSVPWLRMRYGYLWHVEDFDDLGHGALPSHSARGNGGNEVHVFPTLDLVVVTTGSAYNQSHSTFQQREILARYLLPAMLDPGKRDAAPPRRREIPAGWLVAGLGLGAAALATGVAGLAAGRIAKLRLRAAGRARAGWGTRAGMLAGWIVLGACTLVTLEFLDKKATYDSILNGGLAHFPDDRVRTIVLFASAAVKVTTAGVAWMAARAWLKGHWSSAGRLSAALMALALAAAAVAADLVMAQR
jgi:hypothetical protein